MPKYIGLGLDPVTHDLHLDGDHLAMVFDAEAVGQLCKQRLKAYEAEWFLDQSVGVPWFQRVFVRPVNEVVTESIIKRTILRTLGVTDLLAFEMSIDWTQRGVHVLRAQVMSEFDEPVEIAG